MSSLKNCIDSNVLHALHVTENTDRAFTLGDATNENVQTLFDKDSSSSSEHLNALTLPFYLSFTRRTRTPGPCDSQRNFFYTFGPELSCV